MRRVEGLLPYNSGHMAHHPFSPLLFLLPLLCFFRSPAHPRQLDRGRTATFFSTLRESQVTCQGKQAHKYFLPKLAQPSLYLIRSFGASYSGHFTCAAWLAHSVSCDFCYYLIVPRIFIFEPKRAGDSLGWDAKGPLFTRPYTSSSGLDSSLLVTKSEN